MRTLQVNGASDTGFEITGRHFGANIIATEYTEEGQTLDSFRDAIDALDIRDIRYPAGQPDVMYASGLLQNGQLPDHVHRFFASIQDRPGQVVMVTPTFDAYGGPEELNRFAELVLESYGDKVRAFEIGNEYWQEQGETTYGSLANESVLAIEQAANAAGVATDIWVQMANAAGGASDFKNHPSLGWIDSTIEANKAIINELSPQAIAAIDGVVEHSYNRDTGKILGDEFTSTNMLSLDIETWRNTTGRDYDLALTEWNIRTSNSDQLGVKAASTLIHHFENLIRLGADDMHVWSPQHNTTTDLAGSKNVLVDVDTGVVKNTVTGAAYDLMSSSLVGKSLLELEIAGEYDLISTHGYASASEVTIYVASRSEQSEAVSFSLGDTFDGASLTSALHLGYDSSADSSDGVHWYQPDKQFVESQSIMVDGERYYLNEHDANAAVEHLAIPSASASGAFSFDLLPYEVVELTYSIGNTADPNNAPPGPDAETQHIFSINGQDTIQGGTADDLISGGNENDELDGGAGNDTVRAGSGFDTITGGEGDDALFGDFNADTFVFEDDHGHDIIADFDIDSQIERIDLRDVTPLGEFDDLQTKMQQDQADVVITTGSDSSIRIRNATVEELSESDFVF